MMILSRFTVIALIATLSACGGGGSSSAGSASNGSSTTATASWPSAISDAASYNSGLESRSSSSCSADNFASPGASIALQRVASQIEFNQPLKMLPEPGNSGYWYMVERGGLIKRFSLSGNSSSVFLDLTQQVATDDQEQGLLGMAFHPDYPATPEVFVSYTDLSGSSTIARYQVSPASHSVLSGSAETVLQQIQPYQNHNGGNIDFGPDGYLYIGLGDGGFGGDPDRVAQNTGTLLGSMLRIDIDEKPYGIPADNPFAGSRCEDGQCPEIWAWGLRNPWRWSFDRSSGQLWAGDVGESAWEEINILEKGHNYGWSCFEGNHRLNSDSCDNSSGMTFPVVEYDHSQGVSVTGGYVYRGSRITALQGHYLFADFAFGNIWSIPADGSDSEATPLLQNSGLYIASFAQAPDGELYLVDFNGAAYQIINGASSESRSNPTLLSRTGCMLAANPAAAANGLIPYGINSPLWSDGAAKQRWMWVNSGRYINVDSDGEWHFPPGSVLVKQFLLAGQPVETRFLIRAANGNWQGLSYAWNSDGSDAELLTTAETRQINGNSWHYPAGQCFQCHSSAANIVLGPETLQMNGDYQYSSGSANQIVTLASIGLLKSQTPTTLESLDALPDPSDSAADLTERARSYLHANCSGCHMPGSSGQGGLDLRYQVALADTGLCGRDASYGGNSNTQGALLTAGDAAQSVLYRRLASTVSGEQMPPLGVLQTDESGLALIGDWINSLGACE